MYGHTVLGVDDAVFEGRLAAARRENGARDDSQLDAATLRRLTTEFRRLLVEHSGEDLPQDPREQLDCAVNAVFDSWNGDRAGRTAGTPGIPDDLGTAVSIVEMVYGNTGFSLRQRCLLHARPLHGSARALRGRPDQRARRGRRQRQPDDLRPNRAE
jgi:phosphoenolpyruvate synthase/pyruvate phosphate dikinase